MLVMITIIFSALVSSTMASPVSTTPVTVGELDLKLNDLVKWDRFGLQLPEINDADIQIIRENINNIERQKIALYSKWLNICVHPSWEHVINALELIGEKKIAQSIRDSVTDTTSKLPGNSVYSDMKRETSITISF